MQEVSDDAAALVVARRVLDACERLVHTATTTTTDASVTAALSDDDVVTQLHADVDTLLRDALATAHVRRHVACFRQLLKAVLHASAHVAHDTWTRVLHCVSALLYLDDDNKSDEGGGKRDGGALPWLHRAFVLKEMPALTHVAPAHDTTTTTLQQQQQVDADEAHTRAVTQRARAVAQALTRYAAQHLAQRAAAAIRDNDDDSVSVGTAHERAVQRAQLRQLAHAAIATLPRSAMHDVIVADLVSALPMSTDVCVAVIAHAHTDDSTRRVFEQCLHRRTAPHDTTTRDDANDSDDDNNNDDAAGTTASDAAAVDAEEEAYATVDAALRAHYIDYGVARVEQLCERLIRDEAQLSHVGAWPGLLTRVLLPLQRLLRDKDNGNSGNNDHAVSTSRIAAAVARRVSLPFVCTCFAQVWRAYATATAATATATAASDAPQHAAAQALQLARALADLAAVAAQPATPMRAQQVSLFASPLALYMTDGDDNNNSCSNGGSSQDAPHAPFAVLDMPMPLLECFLVVAHYSLPCLLPSLPPSSSSSHAADAQVDAAQHVVDDDEAAHTTTAATTATAANDNDDDSGTAASAQTTTTAAPAAAAAHSDAFVRAVHFCKTRVLPEVDEAVWRASRCDAHAHALTTDTRAQTTAATAAATTDDSGDAMRDERAAQVALLRNVARMVQRLWHAVSPPAHDGRKRKRSNSHASAAVTPSWRVHDSAATRTPSTTTTTAVDAATPHVHTHDALRRHTTRQATPSSSYARRKRRRR